MKTTLLPNLNKWSVAYTPYVDTLHAYSEDSKSKKPDQLIEKDYKGYYILLDSTTMKPLLFEMKQASRHLNGIAHMSKRDIIKSIEGYING